MKDLGIEIHLNTEVKDLSKLIADEVIVATGAVANKIPLPGIGKTIEACEYLGGTKKVGQSVIVIGGGLTGCEIAYDLFNQGKSVTIVEMKDDLIAQKGVCMANSTYLREFFALHQVPVYLETKVKAVTDKGITVQSKDGKVFDLTAESVIRSVGYHPTPAFPEDKKVHLVGDCVKVGNLRSVIWKAYETAMSI
jgi:2-enoate reductase